MSVAPPAHARWDASDKRLRVKRDWRWFLDPNHWPAWFLMAVVVLLIVAAGTVEH